MGRLNYERVLWALFIHSALGSVLHGRSMGFLNGVLSATCFHDICNCTYTAFSGKLREIQATNMNTLVLSLNARYVGLQEHKVDP